MPPTFFPRQPFRLAVPEIPRQEPLPGSCGHNSPQLCARMMPAPRWLSCLQGWRLHHLPRQPVPVLGPPHSEELSPDVQRQPPVFVPVALDRSGSIPSDPPPLHCYPKGLRCCIHHPHSLPGLAGVGGAVLQGTGRNISIGF